MNITHINELLQNANTAVGKQSKATQAVMPSFQSILDEAKRSESTATVYEKL